VVSFWFGARPLAKAAIKQLLAKRTGDAHGETSWMTDTSSIWLKPLQLHIPRRPRPKSGRSPVRNGPDIGSKVTGT
jgi:hypothetical protein